jgi:hypothetical protein
VEEEKTIDESEILDVFGGGRNTSLNKAGGFSALISPLVFGKSGIILF